MFKLLRYFSIVSFVAIVITIIVLIVLTRHMAVNQLTELTTQQNIALARSFANALWLSFEPYFKETAEYDSNALTVGPEVNEILEDMKMLTHGLSIVSAKIYNVNGITIFAPGLQQFGGKSNDSSQFLITARNDLSPMSILTHQEQITGFSGLLKQRDLIETYAPIKDPTGSVTAILHLYSDVSTQMLQIEQTQIKLVKALILSFIILYGILFLIVRRADYILRCQHKNIIHKEQTIWRKNRQLEQEVNQRTLAEQALQEAQENLALNSSQANAQNVYRQSVKVIAKTIDQRIYT